MLKVQTAVVVGATVLLVGYVVYQILHCNFFIVPDWQCWLVMRHDRNLNLDTVLRAGYIFVIIPRHIVNEKLLQK